MEKEELNDCTVRLSYPGTKTHEGTGFFVGEGWILTCAHVLTKGSTQQVNVWWQNRVYLAGIKSLPEEPDSLDLALLELIGDRPQHPWVSLDEAFLVRDKLYTFGYPAEYPEGDPGTFEIEGLTGNESQLLKFKQGQVRPGLSGSPLLNERTRKVCGIIIKTRDRSSDLGGRAIPVGVIFDCFPEIARLHHISKERVLSNPFTPLNGRIDEPHQFFGRQKEIRSIFEILNGGSSVAIIGERGIGKSSLLKAICQQAKTALNSIREPVYLNLQGIEDEADFYNALCDKIGIEVCKGYRLTRALEKKRPRVLLAIDEIEKMTWDGFTNQVRGQLRGLAEGSDAPLRLVVAASTSLNRLFPDSDRIGMTSPFKGICIEQDLGLWEGSVVRDFMRYRLLNNQIKFEEADISQIIRESRGHPKELMNLCYKTYQLYASSHM